MKFDLEKTKNNAIHCDTEKKANELLDFLAIQGYKGSQDSWNTYKEKTCYDVCYEVEEDKRIMHSDCGWYQERNYSILEFEDVVSDKPRICEISGVEVGEIFEIEFGKGDSTKGYFFDEKGYLYNSFKQELNRYIADILNGKLKIIKLPNYTDEQKEIFKALKLLGFNYIARDNDEDLIAYKSKPIKGSLWWFDEKDDDIDLNKDDFKLIKWEDKEPFEIPTL